MKGCVALVWRGGRDRIGMRQRCLGGNVLGSEDMERKSFYLPDEKYCLYTIKLRQLMAKELHELQYWF